MFGQGLGQFQDIFHLAAGIRVPSQLRRIAPDESMDAEKLQIEPAGFHNSSKIITWSDIFLSSLGITFGETIC